MTQNIALKDSLITDVIKDLITNIEPYDDLERAHIRLETRFFG